MMQHRLPAGAGVLVLLLAGIQSHAAADPTAADSVNDLAGRVVDAEGAPVAGAYVVLCDQVSGIPLTGETWQRITDSLLGGRGQPPDFAHCKSDRRGHFRFQGVPAGRYRLIAQSWPDAQHKGHFIGITANEIHLRGVADDVVVSKDLSPDVVIRPLGTGVLRIEDNLNKEGVLVAISTAPTRADPALGFVGWGGPFARQAVGWNRKLAGSMTISGLPEGNIYVALCGFSADDMSGFGSGDADVKRDQTTSLTIPILSTWTGHHEPPQRLQPLFEEVKSFGAREFFRLLLQRNQIDLPRAGSLQGMWQRDRVISRHLERKVELPTGGETTFADVMAVHQYIRLQQLREKAN